MLLLIVHQKNTPGKNTSIIRRAWFLNAQPKHLKKKTRQTTNKLDNGKIKYKDEIWCKKQEKEKGN